jgi:hypothetical protein
VIVEMRTYTTKPGLRERFVEIFKARSVPEHAKLGIPIIGPFPSVEHADVFFFMRGFPDLQSRDALKARFYEGKLWKDELEAVLMPMLDKYDVTVVEVPDRVLPWETM